MKYITLVYRYENNSDLHKIREWSMNNLCRAWSMDHEITRLELVSQAIDKGDIALAKKYMDADNIMDYVDDIGRIN